VIAWPAFILPDEPLLTSFTDDTYYYLVVARHVAAGDGFTFDGLHPTNGYQPLWLFLLAPLFVVLPGEFPPLRGLILLQAVILAVAALLLWRLVRRRWPPAVAAAFPLLLVGLPGARLLWLGMESALFLLLLAITWGAWQRLDTGRDPGSLSEYCVRPLEWWWFGLCCAGLWTARLEGGIVLLTALVLLAPRLRSMARPLRPLLAICLPSAVLAVAYVVWNISSFGTWLPISGRVKLHWVGMLTMGQRFEALIEIPWVGHRLLTRALSAAGAPALVVPLAGLLLVVLGAALWLGRRPIRAAMEAAGARLIVVACAAMFLLDHLLIGPVQGEWAQVPLHLLTALGLTLLLATTSRRAWAGLAIAILLCLARPALHARTAGAWEAGFTGRSYRLAEWIRMNTSPDERVGASYAGLLGYFSGRTVVNLDGLVNSADFFSRVMVGNEWESYLQENRITWLADVGCRGHRQMPGMLHDLGKTGRDGRCYRLDHVVRDPSLPVGCGLTMWKVDLPLCTPPPG
jgi:hypothetical protein